MGGFKNALGTMLFVTLFIALQANPLPVPTDNRQTDVEKKELKTLIEANNLFASDLYKAVARGKSGNIAVSPFSVSTALAMTYAGAEGATKEQMESVLHFDKLGSHVHPAFSGLLEGLLLKEDDSGQSLLFANRIWGQDGDIFLPKFTDLINRYYHGGLERVDFINKTNEARKRINRWVEIKTKEKIKELIAIRDLSPLTRLVLTNAIYFKGKWASRFKKENTKDMPFYISDKKAITIPMMSQKGSFPFRKIRDLNLKVLALPYEGNSLSMFIFLPDSPKDLKRVEDELSPERIMRLTASLRNNKVMVYLPRFHLKSKYYLKKILFKMGMGLAFSNRADFSGMTGDKDLKISKVIHQVDINVNEEGTEAAAATAVIMLRKSVARTPVFKADHPFVFVILDRRTGSILFMGRVVKPI